MGAPGAGDHTVTGRKPRGLIRPDQRGATAVEVTILIPAVLLLIGLIVASGRVWFTRTAVSDAAQSVARAATLERTSEAARGAAQREAGRALDTAGLRCVSTSVSVDLGAFASPPGVPATVRARVSCRVSFADLVLPGFPGSMTMTGSGAAALDTYRARS